MSDTDTLVAALRILARDVHCEDGVANQCITEAADTIERLRLTDKEREAVEWFSRFARPQNGPVIGRHAATLRGLLERTK